MGHTATCRPPAQIWVDIAACEKTGAEEVLLELGFTPGGQELSNWLRLLEEFRPASKALLLKQPGLAIFAFAREIVSAMLALP